MRQAKIWQPFTAMKGALPQKKVLSGQGLYLHLEGGHRVMDLISSWWVNLHGHAHPRIAQAIAQQAAKLEQVIFAGYTHEPAQELAQRLMGILPGDLPQVFFSDNGSTAVEVALKMAYKTWRNRGNTKRTKFVSLKHAYHGDTLGAMSLGDRSIFSYPWEDLMFEPFFVSPPITWWGDDQVEAKLEASLQELEDLLEKEGENLAAMVMEPLVQGASGFLMYPERYLQEAARMLKEHGVLLILDEVMTGFGRTGDWFASSRAGVVPDFMCVSKGITGGFMPLAVTFCSQEVADAFYSDDPAKTFFHGHSYTGNALGCAAALASLEILQETQAVFRGMEAWHRQGLESLQDHPRLSRFRTCGTLAAMTWSQGGDYRHQDKLSLMEAFYQEGMLLRPLGQELYLLPPYCITPEELALAYQKIGQVLGQRA